MAKQKGLILLEGTLGGINYYYREGEALARRTGGGFTREAIKGGANMAKVRESNSEFGICSQVNKVFKEALLPFTSGYKDGTLHARLMQLFLKIKACDLVLESGKRSVSEGIKTDAGKSLLQNFVFTPQCPTLFGCFCEFDRKKLIFKVNDFNLLTGNFPKKESYMKLLMGLIRFDFESLSFKRLIADAVIIKNNNDNTITIIFDELPEGDGILFLASRVSFYETISGKDYVIRNADSIGISIVQG